MELCTNTTTSTTSITHLLSSKNQNNNGYLAGNSVFNRRISLLPLPHLQRNFASLNLQSRILRCTGKFPGETVSEETSTGIVNEFIVEKNKKNQNLNSEEAEPESSSSSLQEDEQTQTLDFLNDIKIDSDNTYSILLYGFGAIVALYLTSAIVGSLESIPLFPKLMEVVGLGYTLWFTTRYLLFKKNREELKTKISEIKKQVLGSDSE